MTAKTIGYQQTPRYIIYYNSTVSPLSALLGTPYTHVILSFITASVQNDKLTLQPPEQLAPFWDAVPRLQAEGKKVMISFGGGTMQSKDYGPLVGQEETLAEQIANWLIDKKLDGVDIDYEASDSFLQHRAVGVLDGQSFVIKLHQALRKALPEPYLISHAPQPPYLTASWHGGPYLQILEVLGESVDWIGIQYYNNPGFDAPIPDRIVGTGSDPFATSIAGLTQAPLAWPITRLVVGKPVYKADAANGHISPEAVIDQIIRPLQKRYACSFGGLMGWQFSTHTQDHSDWNTIVGAALLGTK